MTEHRARQVVVIDDDEGVLESFQFCLEAAGLAVAIYRSAVEFLDDGNAAPRCLILDQNMPRMTGTDLAGRLRASGVSVPILIVTSAISPALVARAAELGVARVLAKPPAERDLLAFVEACPPRGCCQPTDS